MGVMTTYFADSTLLLAGGGADAVAFAGACLAAEAGGCRFHAAAATSISAVVAALVAAGCSGRELIRAMYAMVNGDLFGQDECEPPPSMPIRHWVDLRLREKLGLDRPVTFADLPRPLAIMAVDLRRGTPKVWSRATDPQMPVGLAVCSACSNPFVFAPVELDGQLLADGSLQGWSFAEVAEAFEHCSHLPALLLRLSPTEFRDPGHRVTGSWLTRRVGDVAIACSRVPPDSGTSCQDIVIPATSEAAVHPGSSRPAVSRAIRAGYDAVTGFLAIERARVAESGYVTRRLDGGFQPHLVDQIMIEIGSARRNVFIAGGDLSWASKLFPLLALKAMEGIAIRIVSGKSVDPAVSTLLGQLGCEHRRYAGDLRTYGAFIDADEPDGIAVLIKLRDHKLRGGALLGDRYLPGVLAALMERLEWLWQDATPQNSVAQPQFDDVAWERVESALRANVSQYRDARLSPSSVDVRDLLPLASCLRVAKLRRAEAVADLYQHCGQPLFDPMRLRAGAWFLPPPVIEAVDGRWVVVDGEHRVLHCRRRGIATIRAMVVRNAGEPLPAKIGRGWDTVVPLPFDLDRVQRYEGYVPRHWRDLKAAWMAMAHQSLPDRPSAQAVRYPSGLPQS
jgi:hypothetical protein